ncbi:MAG: GGDEF domain-containing protein [Prolixibacteraceae bacterium]|nr:GGDEF domain-containing protein [Burkholderiales bacterium]
MILSRDELNAIALPAAVLVMAGIAASISQKFSTTLGNFGVFGPYAVLVIGTAIALWFNRGRAFIALSSLLVAFVAYRIALGFGQDGFAVRAVLTAAAIFVPANILLVQLLPERGIVHFRNYRWLLLGVVEVLITAWIATAGHTALSGTSWHAALDHWLLKAAPTPLLGRIFIAAALAIALRKAWLSRSPLDVGMAGALVAFFIACEWPSLTVVYGVFVFSAGAMLLLAVLQESHRMAFRDELTGLPSRRALQEKLVALGPSYTIAMVDVDHFKKFNDTHGHDVGDQVLKLVGARLAEIDGGGKAFRYGGEEFAVLFPDKKVEEALPRLETLRKNIEGYKMAVRTEHHRRSEPRDNKDRRTRSKSAIGPDNTDTPPLRSNRGEMLSVTVSIGAAHRADLLDTPESVIRSADEALYRAKGAGRNRVSI